MASPMAPEVLTGYVALSHADKKAFDDSGELRPEIFNYPGVLGKFTPLDDTAEDAVETALLQWTSTTFEVTASDTTWHVLKVSFLGDVIADMCSAGELRRGAADHPLQLRSPIKAEWLLNTAKASPQVEVIEAVLPQVYFCDWGDRVLSAQWSLQKSEWTGKCQECPYSGRFTWKAAGSGGGWFCAECWHEYCMDSFWTHDSLHELQQQALPASEVGLSLAEVSSPPRQLQAVLNRSRL